MTPSSYRSSRPNQWISPRQSLDAHQRFRAYGPIQPMEQPRTGIFARLLGVR